MSIDKYLQKHAQPAALEPPLPGRTYQQALVVPFYDEPPDSLGTLLSQTRRTPLVIAVVNCPDDAPDEPRARTRELLPVLRAIPHTVVIDHTSAGRELPRRSAVGLARKIGTDTALRLYREGRITSPWIYQSDADAILPENYFDAPLPQAGAVVFRHRHVSRQPCLSAAAQLYDAHMAYYVRGLAHAGSPYAFPTLGSTIAIHAQTYAAVRGYPRRNAAEDFYLLNKAAKVHGVARGDATLTLQARLSTRVPFGTGPALARIVDQLSREAPYLSYHPASFELLATTFGYLSRVADEPSLPVPDPRVAAALNTLGFEILRPRLIEKYPTAARRGKVLTDWFDGFRTLRFIHEARTFYPDTPLMTTLRSGPDWCRSGDNCSGNSE